MDVKLAAAVAGSVRRGEVSAFCATYGISRQTFYKWRRRHAAEGLDGLAERSRRPRRQPGRIVPDVEDAIVRVRKELLDNGCNAGPWTIHNELVAAGLPTPSEATIWRVLVARGLVERQPAKRPRASLRRFVWERPNDCWQIDATHIELADATIVEVINIVDDHSRVAVGSLAVASCTTVAAWAAFTRAAVNWGVPARMLSDNGLAFSGKRRGDRVVAFEDNLHVIGVHTITSSPYHPQTCGKVERFHQTMKQWLNARPPAATLTELQVLLDRFIEFYNQQRPHHSLRRNTPAAVWAATPRATPAAVPVTATTTSRTLTVDARGVARAGRYWFGIGSRHKQQQITLITTGDHIAAFNNATLIATGTINTHTRYQRLHHLPH